MARVAYGHPEARDDDFLAHWFEQQGWPFTAISYPVEVARPAFEVVDRELGLASYNEAVAAYVSSLIQDWKLGSEVVVLGWSAAGNSAPGLRMALRERDIDLALFVALAATPPVPNLVLGSLEATQQLFPGPQILTSSGLVAHAMLRSFEPELIATDTRYGREVIGADVYFEQYVANMPLNLFPGLEVQFVDGRFVVGHEGSLRESSGADWHAYPTVGVLSPTWRTDARHAVTDAANWALAITNMLYARYVAATDLPGLSDGSWRTLTETIVGAPDRLHRSIEGGHMFFVGCDGAEQTVAATAELLTAARGLAELLGSLVEGA